MRRERARALVLAVVLALAPLPARAEPVEAGCLPPDLGLRVPLEPPSEIARRVRDLLLVGEDVPKRREALRGLFREAGCASIEERSDPELSGPSLVCALPGSTSELVVVGASPEFDGMSPSALLPSLAAVLARSDRTRTFELVAYAPHAQKGETGAVRYVETLAEQRGDPGLLVHLGYVGHGSLRLEQGTTESQACVLRALAERLGLELAGAGRESAESRAGRSGPLDRRIPFAGLTARRAEAALQGHEHYAGYRLLAAYLLTIDQLGVR